MVEINGQAMEFDLFGNVDSDIRNANLLVRQDDNRNTCVAVALTMLANYVFQRHLNLEGSFNSYAVSRCLVQYTRSLLEEIKNENPSKTTGKSTGNDKSLKSYLRAEYVKWRDSHSDYSGDAIIDDILKQKDEKASLLAVNEAFFGANPIFGFVKKCERQSKKSKQCCEVGCKRCQESVYKFDFCTCYMPESFNDNSAIKIKTHIGDRSQEGIPLIMMVNEEWIHDAETEEDNSSNCAQTTAAVRTTRDDGTEKDNSPNHAVLITGYNQDDEGKVIYLKWYDGLDEGRGSIYVSVLTKKLNSTINQPIMVFPIINQNLLEHNQNLLKHYDIFISYRDRASRNMAEYVKKQLEREYGKEKVFLAARDITGESVDIRKTCLKHVRTCNTFFLILSKDSISGDEVAGNDIYLQEIEYAEKAGKKTFILYDGDEQEWNNVVEKISKKIENIGIIKDTKYYTRENWFNSFVRSYPKKSGSDVMQLVSADDYSKAIDELMQPGFEMLNEDFWVYYHIKGINDEDKIFPVIKGWTLKRKNDSYFINGISYAEYILLLVMYVKPMPSGIDSEHKLKNEDYIQYLKALFIELQKLRKRSTNIYETCVILVSDEYFDDNVDVYKNGLKTKILYKSGWNERSEFTPYNIRDILSNTDLIKVPQLLEQNWIKLCNAK